MKVRIPLFVKIIAPLTILLFVTVWLSGYQIYTESTQRWQNEMDARLERMAQIVATSVSAETLQSIQGPDDVHSEDYRQIKNQLDQILTAGGLGWVGIYYRYNGHLYYWVDSSETGVGYPFLYPTTEHEAAFSDPEHTIRWVSYSDEFGSYYGAIAPIVVEGPDGSKIIGIVEASVDGESSQLIHKATLQRIIPLIIWGSLSAVILSTLFAYILFNRPLQQLKNGAIALAQGDFDHVLNVNSQDELGEMAATFNQMSAQIKQLHEQQLEMERQRRQEEINRLQESERMLEARVAERTAELLHKNEELLRTQEDLATARDQAMEANRAKSDFISLVAHELKVPMTSIKGYAELLTVGAAGPISETQSGMLNTIRNNIERMTTLVSDLADISRIESGRLFLDSRALNLREIVDEVAQSSQHQITEHNLQFGVQVPASLPQVLADRNRVTQILLNLVSNAYKYTPPGGKITIRADMLPPDPKTIPPQNFIHIAVVDTGIGISIAEQDKIFQKFFRSADRRAREAPGTGLGLSITRHLVEIQGGRIWFESEYGQGTTFHFTLPCAPIEKITPSIQS